MDEKDLLQLMDVFARHTQIARKQLEHEGPVTLGTSDAKRRLRYVQLLQNIELALPHLYAAYEQAGSEGLLDGLDQLSGQLRLRTMPPAPELNTLILELQHDWVDVLHPLEAIGKWPPTMRSVGPWPPRTSGSADPASDEGSRGFDADERMLSVGKWPPE